MTKITISTITDSGVFPQFFQTFRHSVLADEYADSFRKMAAKAGVLIRVDREEVKA